ncbi:MAG: hypothetical protein ACOYJ1_08320 [Peptococcales bacterium]|jgi:chromosome segregation ATPase
MNDNRRMWEVISDIEEKVNAIYDAIYSDTDDEDYDWDEESQELQDMLDEAEMDDEDISACGDVVADNTASINELINDVDLLTKRVQKLEKQVSILNSERQHSWIKPLPPIKSYCKIDSDDIKNINELIKNYKSRMNNIKSDI